MNGTDAKAVVFQVCHCWLIQQCRLQSLPCSLFLSARATCRMEFLTLGRKARAKKHCWTSQQWHIQWCFGGRTFLLSVEP